jgi:hypothetical protein
MIVGWLLWRLQKVQEIACVSPKLSLQVHDFHVIMHLRLKGVVVDKVQGCT